MRVFAAEDSKGTVQCMNYAMEIPKGDTVRRVKECYKVNIE
jgi:hypothetical protein